LELFPFEITIERKKKSREKRREKEREGVPKNFFSYPPLYKIPIFFPSFLNVPTHKKLHTHPPKKCNRHHNKTFSLQTKSITQILKIKKIATT
jgi:hypothetical protein